MKNGKNILIGALLVTIMIMSVGYASFATNLDINGTATIAGEWDVEITNITSSFSGTASNASTPLYTKTTATFDAQLMAPGDTATYTITVANKGNIAAKLNAIALTPQTDGSDAIIYTIKQQPSAGDILAPNGTTTVVIEVKYDSSVTETPSVLTKTITGTLEYVQSTN
jgi:uncharacterized repeat protein (TIGR01451 family)